MKFYDFGPGMSAIRRMFHIALLKYSARRKMRHRYRFFTDGIGYIDQQIAADGLFEQGLIDHICDVAVAHGMTDLYVDIGANIGNHVVGVSRVFDKVVAFEPHPVLFHVLQANILANDIGCADVYNYGLGLKDEDSILVENPDNHGLSKVEDLTTMSSSYFNLSQEAFSNRYKVSIKSASTSLNEYADTLSRAFIKIDVEGMEGQIIEALMPLLKEHSPVLAFEWVPDEQPQLKRWISELDEYDFYTVSIWQSSNFLARHFSNFFRGRRYEMRELDLANLPSLIPLVFAIPKVG